MANISATRAELAARRERLELARSGQEMLEKKRAALLRELMPIVDRVLAGSEELEAAARKSQLALNTANAQAGDAQVKSAALAAQGELRLGVDIRNIMGVRVPQFEQRAIRRSPLARGFAVTGASLSIDAAAEAFEEEVEAILSLAESELHLRRLSEEVRKITRRVNSLDQVMIPRIQNEIDYIEMKLDERERERNYRLRLVKGKIQARQGRDEEPGR